MHIKSFQKIQILEFLELYYLYTHKSPTFLSTTCQPKIEYNSKIIYIIMLFNFFIFCIVVQLNIYFHISFISLIAFLILVQYGNFLTFFLLIGPLLKLSKTYLLYLCSFLRSDKYNPAT